MKDLELKNIAKNYSFGLISNAADYSNLEPAQKTGGTRMRLQRSGSDERPQNIPGVCR
jgi:hypothetical protein